MEKNSREYYWKRLDNAAKGFSAISDSNNTNVFRLAIKLTEPIAGDLLQKATEMTLSEFPTFNVKLRKGFFWYYFESNFAIPIVQEECTFPCLKIDRIKNNGFLFRVSYFQKRINLEVFHVLSDGNGAVLFLKRLTYNYLCLAHPSITFSEVDDLGERVRQSAYEEDSFLHNYSTEQEKKGHKEKRAYRVKGPFLEPGVTRVITGVMPASQVLKKAKESGATVTEYLSAVLLQSLFLAGNPRFLRERPIVLCVPINLRGFYDSKTLGNFFSYLNVGLSFNKNYEFSEIVKMVQERFREGLSKERIEERLRYNVEAETNPAVRFVPLLLKRIGLKVIHGNAERSQSCALSNLGILKLPADIGAYVERLDVMVSISNQKPIKAGVMTFGDRLSFTFTASRMQPDIEQCFFSFLSEQGIDIEIISNEV